MYARTNVNEKYKYCKASTEHVRSVFGSVVKRVFTLSGEFAEPYPVSKEGSWDGMRILVEFSNGRYVSMNNSEWASFYKEGNVIIS